MKSNVTISKQFGQFDLVLRAEIADGQKEKLVELGLLYLVERTPSSQAEQKVFAPLCRWQKTDNGKSYKRPKGFERNSVEYTEEIAKQVRAAYESTPAKLGKGETAEEIQLEVVSIVKYEGGEASPMVRATAFVDLMLASAEDNMRTTFLALGLDEAAAADREALITFAHAKGFGVDPKKVS